MLLVISRIYPTLVTRYAIHRLTTKVICLVLFGAVAQMVSQPCFADDKTFDSKALYRLMYNKATVGYNQPRADDQESESPYALPRPKSLLPDVYQTAVAAYMWGLPLVEMRRTQEVVLNQYDLKPNELYTPGFVNRSETVVAPNLDILNATGFIDFSELPADKQAFVITVPDTRQPDTSRGTFNVMQLCDAYTNVVGSFGTRQDDKAPDGAFSGSKVNERHHFLISGPGYEGEIPDVLSNDILYEQKVDTNQVWLIGRVNVDPYTDSRYDNSEYQQRLNALNNPFDLSVERGKDLSFHYHLTPLDSFPPDGAEDKLTSTIQGQQQPREDWQNDPRSFPMFGDNMATWDDDMNGGAGGWQSTKWTPEKFLEYLGESIVQNPISDENPNRQIFDDFSILGLTDDGYTEPDSDVRDKMYAAVNNASDFLGYLTRSLNSSSDAEWSDPTDPILGEYEANPTGWLTAGVVAAVGIGANRPEDGVYPLALVDASKNPLNGENNYTITFSADQLPQIHQGPDGSPLGFWSLTIYDADGRIIQGDDAVKNPYYGDDVYSLGSTQLEVLLGENPISEDVTFYLSRDAPSDELLPYWLPLPADKDFQVMMRIYGPVLDENDTLDWTPPSVFPALGIPEPSSLALALLGIACLVRVARQNRC
ncbi:MAG: DUF1214 domain-containing protein [Pirellulales bacterium]